MAPWHFADRGWFFNDQINLCAAANREHVAAALQFPNIVFGLHRWYAWGCAPDPIAIATSEQWERELARGRPGDNLMLLSLDRVASAAMAHIGAVLSDEPLQVPPEVLEQLCGFLDDDRHEVAVVHRFAPRPGELQCSYEVLWGPEPDEWREQIASWSRMKGELFFFDNEIVWQDHDSRVRAQQQPPEEWTAQHGMFLVDGYIPDDEGRVVCGGPY